MDPPSAFSRMDLARLVLAIVQIFGDISMIVIPPKKTSIRGSWDLKQSNYKLQKAVSKYVISKLSF